jgi:UDP-N-acetylglucosamine 2-epimerase (non-hydrolysing)
MLCVAGARPNYMKLKPVVDALDARAVEVEIVHTGQHYDPSMNEVFFEELGIREPDHWLGVGSGSHAEQTARVMLAFEPLVESLAPDVVVVVGDVNSTMACALTAAKSGALVAHVEAGLRSRDWSMPEEVNRVVADRVSDYLFATSEDAAANLRAEGYRTDQIHVVGNVMIDTLLANRARALERDVLQRLGLEAHGFGLVTLHRPANVDDPTVLRRLVRALEEVAMGCPLVLPAHPRAIKRLREFVSSPNIRIVEALGYLDFIALEDQARIVLTDSGGVQEETTVLGVPCLTLRDNTERPITVTEGTNTLVGRNAEQIVAEAGRVLREGVPSRHPPLWDGKAAERIADVLVEAQRSSARLRPTDQPSGEDRSAGV